MSMNYSCQHGVFKLASFQHCVLLTDSRGNESSPQSDCLISKSLNPFFSRKHTCISLLWSSTIQMMKMEDLLNVISISFVRGRYDTILEENLCCHPYVRTTFNRCSSVSESCAQSVPLQMKARDWLIACDKCWININTKFFMAKISSYMASTFCPLHACPSVWIDIFFWLYIDSEHDDQELVVVLNCGHLKLKQHTFCSLELAL